MRTDEERQRELDEEFVRSLAVAMGPKSRSAKIIAELTRRRQAGENVVLIVNSGHHLAISEVAPDPDSSAEAHTTNAVASREAEELLPASGQAEFETEECGADDRSNQLSRRAKLLPSGAIFGILRRSISPMGLSSASAPS